MSLSSALNENVVKTALDKIWDQEFDGSMHPGHATAQTAAIFNQDKADNQHVIQEVLTGPGAWEKTAEEENLPIGDPKVSQQKDTKIVKFAKSLKIPYEFFQDNMHGAYQRSVRQFARRAATARDKNAFGVFRNAFSTQLTADGLSLGNNSHVTGSGATVDNLITDALSETSLNTAMVMMYEQLAQDGEIDGHVPAVLLVAPANFKLACEITDSELRSGTADNDMNYYSQKFPGLMVYTSPFLGTVAGGDDNDWHLLSNTHSIDRYVREGVSTNLVSYEISENDVYTYKGRFREEVDAISYEGYVGSNVA